jgi:hypothetical protein
VAVFLSLSSFFHFSLPLRGAASAAGALEEVLFGPRQRSAASMVGMPTLTQMPQIPTYQRRKSAGSGWHILQENPIGAPALVVQSVSLRKSGERNFSTLAAKLSQQRLSQQQAVCELMGTNAYRQEVPQKGLHEAKAVVMGVPAPTNGPSTSPSRVPRNGDPRLRTLAGRSLDLTMAQQVHDEKASAMREQILHAAQGNVCSVFGGNSLFSTHEPVSVLRFADRGRLARGPTSVSVLRCHQVPINCLRDSGSPTRAAQKEGGKTNLHDVVQPQVGDVRPASDCNATSAFAPQLHQLSLTGSLVSKSLQATVLSSAASNNTRRTPRLRPTSGQSSQRRLSAGAGGGGPVPSSGGWSTPPRSSAAPPDSPAFAAKATLKPSVIGLREGTPTHAGSADRGAGGGGGCHALGGGRASSDASAANTDEASGHNTPDSQKGGWSRRAAEEGCDKSFTKSRERDREGGGCGPPPPAMLPHIYEENTCAYDAGDTSPPYAGGGGGDLPNSPPR